MKRLIPIVIQLLVLVGCNDHPAVRPEPEPLPPEPPAVIPDTVPFDIPDTVPAERITVVDALYRTDGELLPVSVQTFEEGDTHYYIIDDQDVALRFCLRGDSVTIENQPVISTEPGYMRRSTFDAEEHRFNLAIIEGDSVRVDYLMLSDESDWADAGACEFTDGWFLPVVWYQAQYFEPSENAWAVWMQQSKSTPGLYRVIDPYHNGCPLTMANCSDPGTEIIIDARDAMHVVVERQDAGFVNPDIFPDGAQIGADEGTFASDIISIPTPLRSTPDGMAPNKRGLPSIFRMEN